VKPDGLWARIRRENHACFLSSCVFDSGVVVGAAEKMVNGWDWSACLRDSEGTEMKMCWFGSHPFFIFAATRAVLLLVLTSQFAERRIVSSSSRTVRVAGCVEDLSHMRYKTRSMRKIARDMPTYGREV